MKNRKKKNAAERRDERRAGFDPSLARSGHRKPGSMNPHKGRGVPLKKKK